MMNYTLFHTLQTLLFMALYIGLEPLFIVIWVDGIGYIDKQIKKDKAILKSERLKDCLQILLAAGFMYMALRVNDNMFQLHKVAKVIYIVGILLVWVVIWCLGLETDNILVLALKYAESILGFLGYGISIYEVSAIVAGTQQFRLTIVLAILVIYVLIYLTFKTRYESKEIMKEMVK